MQDIRYAARVQNVRVPIVALLTLPSSASTARSSASSRHSRRPLPVERPDQLVDIYGRESNSSAHETSSCRNYLAYRAQATTISVPSRTRTYRNLSIEAARTLSSEDGERRYFNTGFVRRLAACHHGGISRYRFVPVAVISDRL